jgi:RadC-like JAB domain-containing protein
MFLDAQNRLLGYEELFRGTLTQTSVYPREVVKAALRYNAAGVDAGSFYRGWFEDHFIRGARIAVIHSSRRRDRSRYPEAL